MKHFCNRLIASIMTTLFGMALVPVAFAQTANTSDDANRPAFLIALIEECGDPREADDREAFMTCARGFIEQQKQTAIETIEEVCGPREDVDRNDRDARKAYRDCARDALDDAGIAIHRGRRNGKGPGHNKPRLTEEAKDAITEACGDREGHEDWTEEEKEEYKECAHDALEEAGIDSPRRGRGQKWNKLSDEAKDAIETTCGPKADIEDADEDEKEEYRECAREALDEAGIEHPRGQRDVPQEVIDACGDPADLDDEAKEEFKECAQQYREERREEVRSTVEDACGSRDEADDREAYHECAEEALDEAGIERPERPNRGRGGRGRGPRGGGQ